MKTLFLCSFIFLLAFSVKAQTVINKTLIGEGNAEPKHTTAKLLKAQPGTYQFIHKTGKGIKQEVFLSDIYYDIEENRDENNEVLLVIGQYTTVKILPRSVIKKADFVPLAEEKIFVTQ